MNQATKLPKRLRQLIDEFELETSKDYRTRDEAARQRLEAYLVRLVRRADKKK